MITVGIDSGSQSTKAVVIRDGEIIGKSKTLTEFDATKAAREAYESALKDAGVDEKEVAAISATGAGRLLAEIASSVVNEVSAAARGTHAAVPETELLIDIGAETCRAIRIQEDGGIRNYEINDKCASGAGTFIESMARTLEITTEEMGPASLRHTKDLPMNAQCVVFAESEVISLIHRQEKIEDIAYGVHVGIANRISSLVRRVGITDNITMTGGPARNEGLVDCLSKELGRPVRAAEDPEYVTAYGAALYAAEAATKQ
ncbi:MAG: acyl-CoA dehydratase activase [Clostridiales Family XIII bacterium]|jgi:benzoyl-CoA reductase subunit D|nr:acyl-CoA dehydratase activase [Clostridiales Family XIII bacterium]